MGDQTLYIYELECSDCGKTAYGHGAVACRECHGNMAKVDVAGAIVE